MTKRLRSPQFWGFFLSIAIMAAVSIAFFYPDNFEGNSLMQADVHQGLANGHEIQQSEAVTGEKALWTNSLFSGMPTFQIAPSYPSNSLFSWIDTAYGLCLPAPSNLLFMMMFGFLIMLYCMRLRWYYALLGALAWGLSSYYIIIIGAGHIWKFITLAYIPPTIGGLVLCYRGRYLPGAAITALFAMMQLNANHPQMSYYFAFVMAAMSIAYLITAIRTKKFRQWLTATAILAGAGLLAFGANLPGIYNTYEYSKETKRAQSELTPLPSASDTAAPAERPTGGLPKGDIVNWSYGRGEMLSLLIPDIKGGATMRPERGTHTPMTLDKLPGASTSTTPDIQPLLQYFTQYFNDSEGTNGPVYVGALIFALCLLACIIVRGPMKWALVTVLLFTCALSLGRNFAALTDFMIYNFPMYNKFRAVESILVVAEFIMPLLAVLALDRFLRPADSPDSRLYLWGRISKMQALYIAFGIPAAICLLGIIAPAAFGSAITTPERGMLAQVMAQDPAAAARLETAVTDLRMGMVRSDSLRSLIFIVLGFAALYFAHRRKLSVGATAACITVLVLADLYNVDKRYVSHDSFSQADYFTQNYYDPFAPDAVDQAILQDTDPDYRVMDIPGFFSATRSYHHKMLGGYHAAKLNRYEDLIQRQLMPVIQYGYYPEMRSDSIAALYDEQDRPVVDALRRAYRTLDMLNARYIITGDPDRPVLRNPDALGNAWLIDSIAFVDDADAEMAALGSFDPRHTAVADRKFIDALGGDIVKPLPGDSAALTYYSPNTLKYDVNTTSGGIVVFSEVYFPWGWKATIDGAPATLGRVNYILRALRIPAGHHQVTLTFDPDSIRNTAAVAYACVTLIYLLVLLALFMTYMRSKHEMA